MPTTKFIQKFRIGKPVDNGEYALSEYLAAPSWDCDWYWGFGYLQNKDIHHHVDGLGKTHNAHMFDALKKEYGDSLTIKDDKDLWTFCELMYTFYTLKKYAELCHQGGSHTTTNPCADILTLPEREKEINHVTLPAIFDALNDLLAKYR